MGVRAGLRHGLPADVLLRRSCDLQLCEGEAGCPMVRRDDGVTALLKSGPRPLSRRGDPRQGPRVSPPPGARPEEALIHCMILHGTTLRECKSL